METIILIAQKDGLATKLSMSGTPVKGSVVVVGWWLNSNDVAVAVVVAVIVAVVVPVEVVAAAISTTLE